MIPSERCGRHFGVGRIVASGVRCAGRAHWSTMLDWLVLADDRTGALEVSGAIASSLGMAVAVVSRAEDVPVVAASDGFASVVVVDVGTRHLSADAASAQLATVARIAARRCAYKIDSTLRGGWAADVVGLVHTAAGRVVVVAAFPAMGRSCTDGVVHLHGQPLDVGDARAAACSPAPAAHLRAAGVRSSEIAGLKGAEALARWACNELDARPYAVCDAATDGDLAAIGQALAGRDHVSADNDIVVVGTSASIAACFANDVVPRADAADVTAQPAAVGCPVVPGDQRSHVLVVCGSLHPMAASQIGALKAAAQLDGELDDRVAVAVISAPAPGRLRVDSTAAEQAAADLAARTRVHLCEGRVDVMIVVGGDTAAAVLGPAPRLVGGLVGAGMPWSVAMDGSGPVVVTKAGGFGTPDTLVELIAALTERMG